MKKTQIQIQSIIIIFSFFLIIFNCTYFYSEKTESRFAPKEAQKIAVLDFEQDGFLGGAKLGTFAADELTTALFLKRKLKVVDRAQVTAKLIEKKLSTSVLNSSEITELGTALKADFIILGKINNLDNQDFDAADNNKSTIQITFRVISSIDGGVIGIVTGQASLKNEPRKVVSKKLRQMAESVRIKM